jgi:hypothetical protein
MSLWDNRLVPADYPIILISSNCHAQLLANTDTPLA